MFDPDMNALYAARFLSELYREFGDWTGAAGAYHSRTPEYADRYKVKFQNTRIRVADLEPVRPSDTAQQVGERWGQVGTSRAGSLFMSQAANAQPFIALPRAN